MAGLAVIVVGEKSGHQFLNFTPIEILNENVKSKIIDSGEYINLAICEKPLNIDFVKNFI